MFLMTVAITIQYITFLLRENNSAGFSLTLAEARKKDFYYFSHFSNFHSCSYNRISTRKIFYISYILCDLMYAGLAQLIIIIIYLFIITYLQRKKQFSIKILLSTCVLSTKSKNIYIKISINITKCMKNSLKNKNA